jgi:hypothetical protein
VKGVRAAGEMAPLELADARRDGHHHGGLANTGEDGDERVGLDGILPVLQRLAVDTHEKDGDQAHTFHAKHGAGYLPPPPPAPLGRRVWDSSSRRF